MSLNKPTIVIVGAGAAGLAAAERLYETNKFHVKVLDAQDRIGGRVFSQHIDTSRPGQFVELGAQWIHGEDHPIYRFAQENRLILEKSRDSLVDEDEATGEFVFSSGRTVSEDEKKIVEDCLLFLNSVLVSLENPLELSPEELNQLSMGDFVEQKFSSFLRESNEPSRDALRQAAYDWFLRYQLLDNACYDLKQDLSLRAFSDYGLVGDATVRLKVPLAKLLTVMSPTFPLTQVYLNNPVTRITFMGNTDSTLPLRICCRDGQVIAADHVIVTVSLGVLKECPELFQPPLLATKRQAIDRGGFGSISKLLLEFPHPFWETLDPATDGFQCLWMDAHDDTGEKPDEEQDLAPWCRSALGFDVVRSAKNILVLWIAGQAGLAVDKMTTGTLLEDTWQLLCRFAGTKDIPKPIRVIREAWSTNPFFRGTYSFYSLASSKAGTMIEHLAEPVWEYASTRHKDTCTVPGLLFAGEATHSKFFSTVHGAVLSGRREADRLIALY